MFELLPSLLLFFSEEAPEEFISRCVMEKFINFVSLHIPGTSEKAARRHFFQLKAFLLHAHAHVQVRLPAFQL
jgi:hypothetical protein